MTWSRLTPEQAYGWPPILPGLLVGLLLAILLCVPVGRRLGAGTAHAWFLLVALGTILSITLTPRGVGLDFGSSGSPTCDLSRIGPAPWAVYAHFDDPILNVLLFIPLGAAIGALDRPRPRYALLALGLALPWAIEATQALVVALGRACEAGDVFDNSAGLVLGFVAAFVVAAAWRRMGRG